MMATFVCQTPKFPRWILSESRQCTEWNPSLGVAFDVTEKVLVVLEKLYNESLLWLGTGVVLL